MQLLIIAGTSKAATTSLFEYLKPHSAINASFPKQTFFFLDPQMSQNGFTIPRPFENSGDHFLQFFKQPKPQQWLLEASPDYMYDSTFAQRLVEYCHQYNHTFKVIISLRNPTTRVASWYNYGKSQGTVPQNMSFDQFVSNCQLQHPYKTATMPFTAIHTGQYTKFIAPMMVILGRENMIFVTSEQLQSHPQNVLQYILRSCNLEAQSIDNQQFENHNTSKAIRSPIYSQVRKSIRKVLLPLAAQSAVARAVFAPFLGIVRHTLDKANTKSAVTEPLLKSQLKALQPFFEADIDQLEKLIDQKFDWFSK